VDTTPSPARHEDGWYLYGITSLTPAGGEAAWTATPELDIVGAALDLGPGHVRVQLLKRGHLAAIVRRVALADFTAEALQTQLGDPSRLKLAVQLHNDVIHAVHQRRAILPARFGAVYASLGDIAAAIDQRADALLAQLAWLDGCDEWGVHVYVDRRIVRESVRADQILDPAQQQLTTASPGRAYFLRRKLDDDLAARTARITEEIALAAYERLARLATDGIAERPTGPSGDADREAEVLRATFLVRRERSAEFIADARACADAGRGWHCTYSGPWPPYSFASIPERESDDRQDA
jgi:hypothetical protein